MSCEELAIFQIAFLKHLRSIPGCNCNIKCCDVRLQRSFVSHWVSV